MVQNRNSVSQSQNTKTKSHRTDQLLAAVWMAGRLEGVCDEFFNSRPLVDSKYCSLRTNIAFPLPSAIQFKRIGQWYSSSTGVGEITQE